MTPEELLGRSADRFDVRRAFGEPIEREGVVVVPVAVAWGTGGGGSGPDGQGSGTGFAGVVRGIGVYTIRDGKVRFVPAVDVTALAGLTWLVARALSRAARRRRRSR
jgi:uncharacterized spore protein YtfJ